MMRKVFVDGACSNNGKSNAKSGIGIYFGSKDRRNVSASIISDNHTNNIAELMAILVVLKIIYKTEEESSRNYIICSDSQYSINCVNDWIFTWQKNGWKTKNNKPVKNKDIIEKIYDMLSHMKDIKFLYVKGHSKCDDENSIGNNFADKLATKSISKFKTY